MRCLVCRELAGQPFQRCTINAVNFRDNPAAVALELSKVRMAIDTVKIYALTAQQLVKSGYNGDIEGGGSSEEVTRMSPQR